MNNTNLSHLQQGFYTAFIDSNIASSLAYRPQFVSNNYKEGRKVLSSIEDELLTCNEFSISVAFITMGGITPLLQTLKELEKRNIHGRILTTDYLNFSEPRALRKLAELKNITIKMYSVIDIKEDFHTRRWWNREFEMISPYKLKRSSENLICSMAVYSKSINDQ